MAPKQSSSLNNNKTADLSKEADEFHFKDGKIWSKEFIEYCIFICSVGSTTEVDPDGRKTEVFTIEGYNCKGSKFIIQVWGLDAKLFEEWFR
jgi:hypothetical protein